VPLLEVICVSPGISPKFRSSGVVTVLATVCASAPGKSVGDQDRRRVDVRQSRHRQQFIADRAEQQNRRQLVRRLAGDHRDMVAGLESRLAVDDDPFTRPQPRSDDRPQIADLRDRDGTDRDVPLGSMT
jgi:hypothetical protein